MNLFSKQIKNIVNAYTKSSIWGKVLVFTVLLIVLIVLFKGSKKGVEGFQQQDEFLLKTGPTIYDDFYADIYDYLVFNSLKDTYEIKQILKQTKPTSTSTILDVGCGTGHHVGMLSAKELNVIGVDNSQSMVAKAKENYPNSKFKLGDVLNADLFENSGFTHILCLYFTIYYLPDKRIFFENCMNWLKPGGYLLLHLVDREQFDPILPPGNPLLFVSPQRYAKKRITNTKVVFSDFIYHADFQLDNSKNEAIFIEKFKNKNDGKVRKHEHVLYMEDTSEILQQAQSAGFIVQSQIDLVHCQYEYQYLYILVKPS